MNLSLDDLLIEKSNIENIISNYNAILYDVNEKIKNIYDNNLMKELISVYGNDVLKISKDKLNIILSSNKFKHYYDILFQNLEDKYGIGIKLFLNSVLGVEIELNDCNDDIYYM